MKISDLQEKVSGFVKNNELETNVETRLLDLTSEIGEVAKAAVKGSHYGKEKFTATDEWTNELGDVLFSLICVANKTEVDLETALNKALAKYQNRFEETGEISSGE
jgi:NTP pyrophosphatase (non-canonical NTP hydrolase)